jgi:cupin 2 domain-containing protein
MHIGNLFADPAPPPDGERFETLLDHKNLVIERIVSPASTTRTEYLQPQDEWVLLLKGEATMTVAGEPVELNSGDYVFLPARVPHTVERVSEGAVWLAVHLHQE